SDVSTFLTQDNPHIDSEYESFSENENSQSKMVNDDDEDKMVSNDDGEKGLSEVIVWSFLLL
ncbi:hypothetical protein A2U01_0100839, partial [Trifolium medium]|nr:hypothetical protein [Trifolium medium]